MLGHGKQKCCWFVAALAVILILLGVLVAIFFMTWVNLFIDHEVTLREGAQVFELWSKPPITPFVRLYVYNVTNADEFLNNGSKPILQEVGPYVYLETWEKKNIVFHDNNTVSFQQEKIYRFDRSQSYGSEDDVVVVPNIPMLSATSQSKHAARFLRLAMASIMEALKIKPFVEVTVGQLLWGYEDPLLQLAKDVVSKDTKLPYDAFGLMYNKNGTSQDVWTIFTGAGDVTRFGLLDNVNGRSALPHWTSDECNNIQGSDGSLFPPHLTKETTLYIYDKDLCRRLPLRFLKEVETPSGVTAYRFTPPTDVFATPDEKEANRCFCPHGPPCAPSGFFNVSLCQLDSPVLLSFPHFYLANDSYRTALDGVSPPEMEKHALYIDVNPILGAAMAARARLQINLAVSHVADIKQVASFPDMVFPVLWLEEGLDSLPPDVTSLMALAADAPPVARVALAAVLAGTGVLLLLLAAWRLVRGARRLSSLQLAQQHN